MKNVSTFLTQDIIASYIDGLSMGKIAQKLGINTHIVFDVLHDNNIQLRTTGSIYALNEENVVQEYKDGWSTTKLGKKYNVTCNTIINILKKHGIDRDNIYYNKRLCRNYWEVIDTYDKAYFFRINNN